MCNIWNTTGFNKPLIKTVYDGLESLSYLGSKIWNMLSVEKKIEALLDSKTKIKIWNPNRCFCRISKNYICSIGYI